MFNMSHVLEESHHSLNIVRLRGRRLGVRCLRYKLFLYNHEVLINENVNYSLLFPEL